MGSRRLAATGDSADNGRSQADLPLDAAAPSAANVQRRTVTETLYRLIFNRLHGMTHKELSERPQRIAGLIVPEGEGDRKSVV